MDADELRIHLIHYGFSCCIGARTRQHESTSIGIRLRLPRRQALQYPRRKSRMRDSEMHRVQTSQPRPELREFVRAFGLREMALPGVHHQQSNVSCLEHTIAFDFGTRPSIGFGGGEMRLIPRVHYVGAQTSPSGFSIFTGNVHGFGIFLKPLAPWQLFRIPLLALANRDFDGTEVLGRSVYELWLKLSESKSFSEQVQIAEAYLLPFARNAQLRTDIMKAAHHVFHHKGLIRIEKLAGQAGLSVRQFERRFIEGIGLTPKLFARATRFQMALDASSRFTHIPVRARDRSRIRILRPGSHDQRISCSRRKSSISDRKAHRRHAAMGAQAICRSLLFVSPNRRSDNGFASLHLFRRQTTCQFFGSSFDHYAPPCHLAGRG